MEEIVALPQRVEIGGEVVLDVDVADLGQPVDPGVECRGRPGGHRFVGAKGGQHLDRKGAIGGNRGVMFEAVGRIVGRADQHHVHPTHDSPGGKRVFGQPRVGLAIDALGRLGAQQAVADAQRPLQFQMGPVIERVAERLGNRLRPFLELLPIRRVAGAVAFVDAGRPHGTPLIVIAVEPGLRDVLEIAVLGDLLRRQVAMVVDDRQIAGVLVIELDRLIGLQQEILGDEDVAHERGLRWVLPD